MVGTARSIEITKVSYHIMAAQVQSTDVCLCYQRLRVSCMLTYDVHIRDCGDALMW